MTPGRRLEACENTALSVWSAILSQKNFVQVDATVKNTAPDKTTVTYGQIVRSTH